MRGIKSGVILDGLLHGVTKRPEPFPLLWNFTQTTDGFCLGLRACIAGRVRSHQIPASALNLISLFLEIWHPAVVTHTEICVAQQLAGELLWLSQRTWPDISCAHSLIASLSVCLQGILGESYKLG